MRPSNFRFSQSIGDSWLITSENDHPKPILANALIVLRHDERWKGVLAFDDFAVKVAIRKPTPWGKLVGEEWTDNDVRLTAECLQKENILVQTNLAGRGRPDKGDGEARSSRS